MSRPQVLVVGSGGVGVMLALALSTVNKSDPTLVVRSDYDHVLQHGYHIKSVTYGEIQAWKPPSIVKSVADAAEKCEYDYIVLTTKNIPDGPMTCEDIIRPAVTAKSVIVLVQNGILIEEPMRAAFPNNIVLSGVSLIGSTNINCVVTNSHKDTLKLGLFPHPNIDAERGNAAVETFRHIYQNDDPKISSVIVDLNAEKSRWEKLVYNAVFNTITAIVDLDINTMQVNGANDSLFRPAMREISAIAASEGIEIPVSVHEFFLHIGDGLFYTPSMLVDIRKKQLCEIEVILGNPLKIAARNGVSAPVLTMVYNLLSMVQFRTKIAKGLVKVEKEAFQGHSSDDYPAVLAAMMEKESGSEKGGVEKPL